MVVSPAQQAGQTPTIWAICGPTCSGKSECGRYLGALGAEWHEASEVVRVEVPLDLLPWERFRRTELLFSERGKDYVARHLVEHVLSVGGEQPPGSSRRVVITGFRAVEEVAFLRRQFPVKVAAMHAPVEMRYRWSRERARADGLNSIEDFVRASAWEYAIGLARLIYEADVVVLNCGSVEALQKAISDVVFGG